MKLKLGSAQTDITPEPGIELAGFAVRPQPSTAVLDPLWARALYLEDGPEQLLWLHADLLAFEQPLADRLRAWAESALGLPAARVWVTATHTHSGPATIQLTGCGQVQPAYVSRLEERLQHVARLARGTPEPCRLVTARGHCDLGVDRRAFASAHADPRVAAFAWQRADGTCKAALLSYAMHPVCLRGSGLSADWPGETARILSESLPGRPVTLVCSGACGNIDPPAVGVAPEQMRRWGGLVAQSVLPALSKATASAERLDPANGAMRVATVSLPLPLEDWSEGDIRSYADACLADPAGQREFGDKFRLAVESWRAAMIRRRDRGEPPVTRVELGALALGETTIFTINAEVFSRFTALAGTGTPGVIHTVGCTNGMFGYLPTAEAYDEGAYEVLWSMLFYNLPRPRRGGLERIAQEAQALRARFV